MGPNLDCIWMLKGLRSLRCGSAVSGVIWTLVEEKVGLCVFLGCANLCPWHPQVPPALVLLHRWSCHVPPVGCREPGLGASTSRAKLRVRFVPLSAAGVPGVSYSTLSIIKRKLRANPCATTWLGTQSTKIPVPALSW